MCASGIGVFYSGNFYSIFHFSAFSDLRQRAIATLVRSIVKNPRFTRDITAHTTRPIIVIKRNDFWPVSTTLVRVRVVSILFPDASVFIFKHLILFFISLIQPIKIIVQSIVPHRLHGVSHVFIAFAKLSSAGSFSIFVARNVSGNLPSFPDEFCSITGFVGVAA